MKYIFLCIVVLTALIAGCGCTGKAYSNDVAPDFGIPTTTQTEVIQPTFAPIHPSNRTTSPTVIITGVYTSDPILGNWRLMGDTEHECYVDFNTDNTGKLECKVSFIPVANVGFKWEPVPPKYSLMRGYNITRIDTNENYTVQYSERSKTVVSDLLPAGSYLGKDSIW
jgi:hypothetical protein